VESPLRLVEGVTTKNGRPVTVKNVVSETREPRIVAYAAYKPNVLAGSAGFCGVVSMKLLHFYYRRFAIHVLPTAASRGRFDLFIYRVGERDSGDTVHL
jgi:hypothetical protein